MQEPAEVIRHHHAELRLKLRAHLRAASRGASQEEARAFVAFLQEELLPHAAGEERAFYPALDGLLRAHGRPTRTMRLDHRRIATYVAQLSRISRRTSASPDVEDADRTYDARFRDLSRELGALLDLHFEKEEAVYLPLFERYLPARGQREVLSRMHEAPGPLVRSRRRLPKGGRSTARAEEPPGRSR